MDAYWSESWSGFEFQHEAGVEVVQCGPAGSQKGLPHRYLVEGRGTRGRREEEGGGERRNEVEMNKEGKEIGERRGSETIHVPLSLKLPMRAESCISVQCTHINSAIAHIYLLVLQPFLQKGIIVGNTLTVSRGRVVSLGVQESSGSNTINE